jgi:hypothetical protein
VGTTAGIPPGSVRARHTFDNVGVQYGLEALLSGAISAEESVTLNEKIGGFDVDVDRTAARSVADAQALLIAYRAGIVASGANLGKLPIIDSRGSDEQGIHYIWRPEDDAVQLVAGDPPDRAEREHASECKAATRAGLCAFLAGPEVPRNASYVDPQPLGRAIWLQPAPVGSVP